MLKKFFAIFGLVSFIFFTGCVASTDKTAKVPTDTKTMNIHGGARLLAENLNVSLKGKQLGSFAVADLVGPANSITGLGEQIADNLSVQLFQSINYSDFVERKQFKQLVSTIVSEKSVPYFDQNTVSEYGKSLGLQDMVIGSIRDVGGYYYVIAKIVNISTGKTLSMSEVNILKTSSTQALVDRKQTATLTVSVSPAIQGSITVSGRQYQLRNGAAVIKGVPYGNCAVIIQPYSRYNTIRRNKVIKSPGETLAVTISEKKYNISFTIVPPDATLVIDGKKINLNQYGYAKVSNISAGNHSLIIKSDKKGYKNISQQLNPAVKNNFHINLTTSDPINKFNDTLFQKVRKMSENRDFNVKLWTNQRQFKIGDKIAFYFSSEKNCYLNLIDVGPSGNITLLFPNVHHPKSRITAGRTYKIPDERAGFAFTVDPPAGTERVYAIASTRPLKIFNTNFRGKAFQSITRGKTRDIGVIEAGNTLSNLKLSTASTCIIDVVE